MAIKDKIVHQILDKVQVVVTTCKATKGKLIKMNYFDTVIIDEATQAHEIETLDTIFNARKVVLVGD
jgi:superfamily I DNA and/or RNA helicase